MLHEAWLIRRMMFRTILLCMGLAFCLAATDAISQPYRASTPLPLAGILDDAPAEAAGVFEIVDGGLRHKASGFECPSLGAGIVLSAVGAGALPGQVETDAAFCEYSDGADSVAKVVFNRPPSGARLLERDFCRGLARELGLPLGPGRIFGVGRIDGPAQVPSLPGVPIDGEVKPLSRCSHLRAPMDHPIIVFDAVAIQASSGWAVTVLHTPPPPPCCSGYRSIMSNTFFLLPIDLLRQVADVPTSALPNSLEGIHSLMPGRWLRASDQP
ncbi:MAG: hypothetical protein ACI8U3_002669 [Brevundimonas sp.]|jgi:hypothetical protein|uniref:hypothetical protein n=1 Tax=Brevundimonas sp. TaxID=1871086 RepID=UPI0039E491FD